MSEHEERRAVAAETFEGLERQAGGDPKKLAALASMALWSGHSERACGLACRARRAAAEDPEIYSSTQQAFTAGVPTWHEDRIVHGRHDRRELRLWAEPAPRGRR